MGPVPRLPRSQRRDQLLQAALEQFTADGYHGTSMESIARAAGVTKPVLYQHFASKESLYIDVVRELGNAVVSEIEAISRHLGGTEARLSFALSQFSEIVARKGSSLRLFDRAERVSAPVSREIEEIHQRAVETSARVLRQSRVVGEADALVIGHALVSIARESVDLILRAGSDEDRRRTIALLANLFTNGLSTFPPQPRPQIRGTVSRSPRIAGEPVEQAAARRAH